MPMFLPLARFLDFDGRSRRSEFWLFVLFQLVVAILFWALFLGAFWQPLRALIGDYLDPLYGGEGYGFGYRPRARVFDPRFVGTDLFEVFGPVGLGLLAGYQLFNLLMVVPTLAAAIRRLHDTDRSGWWLFAPLLPYLLAAMFVILALATGYRPGSWLMAAAGGFVLVGLVLALTASVFLLLPGTRGPNRFGPDPVARHRPAVAPARRPA